MEPRSTIAAAGPARTLVRLVVVAALCMLTTWYCIQPPIGDGIVHPAWIPSGIALAAVLRHGDLMGVAVGVGVLVGGLTVLDMAPTTAVLFALGMVAEAIIASRVYRAVGAGRPLADSRGVLGLLVAAPAAAVVSASMTTLAFAVDEAIVIPLVELWVRYLVGAVIAVATVTALALTWSDPASAPRVRRQRIEVVLAAIAVVAIAWMTLLDDNARLVELLLALPALTWAAVRFGSRGATAATTAVTLVVGTGVMTGRTLEGLDLVSTIDAAQAYLAIVATTHLVIAAILNERQSALVRVREVIDTFNHSQRVSRSGSWEYRLDGRERVWCSEELCRLLSIVPETDQCVRLETLLATLPARERERLRAAIRDARLHGRAFRLEQHVPDEHEDERVLLHVGELVPPLATHEVERLVGSVFDVTEERRIEAFKDDLIATASHELRTPLTSIVGFADTLAARWDDVPEPERRSYVGIIDQQAHRLERIVADTLLQSQVDAGTITPERRAFLVGRCVRNVVIALPEAERVELDLEPGVMAIGDPVQFERVVDNLLTNAIKYGRPPIAVRLGMRGEQWTELRVEDHGSGVPGAFRTRLFDRFARGPDVGTAPGTGLGLSISRGLVEAQGGTISYERWHGMTTFVVRLPAAPHPPNGDGAH